MFARMRSRCGSTPHPFWLHVLVSACRCMYAWLCYCVSLCLPAYLSVALSMCVGCVCLCLRASARVCAGAVAMSVWLYSCLCALGSVTVSPASCLTPSLSRRALCRCFHLSLVSQSGTVSVALSFSKSRSLSLFLDFAPHLRVSLLECWNDSTPLSVRPKGSHKAPKACWRFSVVLGGAGAPLSPLRPRLKLTP